MSDLDVERLRVGVLALVETVSAAQHAIAMSEQVTERLQVVTEQVRTAIEEARRLERVVEQGETDDA